MTCYIVSFELPDTELPKLKERLQSLGIFCPIDKTCWAVKTDKTPTQLRDFLREGIALTRIFVIRSGTAAAWVNAYSDKHTEWLKKNL